MFIVKSVKIRSYEAGLYFRDGEFKGLLDKGRYWFFDPLRKVRVDVVSLRDPALVHNKLDMIVKSGGSTGRAVVLDLKDYQRALVWIDGRFSHVLPSGQYNKVMEAKKAAEANLIARREETAAMRSQANTARLLETSPTLMRLRELEVLEKVATSGKLNVVLGEKGLAERVVNLL